MRRAGERRLFEFRRFDPARSAFDAVDAEGGRHATGTPIAFVSRHAGGANGAVVGVWGTESCRSGYPWHRRIVERLALHPGPLEVSRRVATIVVVATFVAHVVHADPSARAKLGDKLVDAGGIILGASYTASFGISAAIGFSCRIETGESLCQHNRFAAGFAPVVGPWVQLGYEHESSSSVALFTVPAAVQVGGLALIIAGGIVELRAHNASRHQN